MYKSLTFISSGRRLQKQLYWRNLRRSQTYFYCGMQRYTLKTGLGFRGLGFRGSLLELSIYIYKVIESSCIVLHCMVSHYSIKI